MLKLMPLIFIALLSACSSQGTYTGVTTYGLGDRNGVKVHKTPWVSDEATRIEGILHCNKYGRSARLMYCLSGSAYCMYKCYDEEREEVGETHSPKASAVNIDNHSTKKLKEKPPNSSSPKSTGKRTVPLIE